MSLQVSHHRQERGPVMGRWIARLGVTAMLAMGITAGLLVTSTQTAQALEWGPADKAAARALVDGFAKGGVRRAAPSVMTRMAARCAGPQAVGCAAGVAAVATLGVAAYKTQDWWVPWLEDQISEDQSTNTPTTLEGGVPCTVADIRFAPGKPVWNEPVPLQAYQEPAGCQPSFKIEYVCKDGHSQTRTAGTYSVGGSTSWQTLVSFEYCTSSNFQNTSGWASIKIGPNLGGGANHYIPETLYWSGGGAATISGNTSVNCTRPDGTQYTKSKPAVADETGNVAIPSCDIGDTMTSFSIGGVTTDMTPSAGDVTAYPICQEQACVYRVVVDGKPCAAGVEACTHWSHLSRNEPDRVECHYGPYVVNVSFCYAMERTYDLSEPPLTSKNTDGNPDTWDAPAPSTPPATYPKPSPSPSPYPTPKPSPSPSPSPSTGTSSPSPTATVGTPTTVGCATPWNLGAVKPVTASGANYLGNLFDVDTVYGAGSRPDGGDHPSGLAADFMVGNFQGDQLAAHAKNRADFLDIQYIIWEQRIWNVDRASEGWRLMEDRGSPTANHFDHVHVSFKDVSGSFLCNSDPGDDPADGACFSANVSFNPVSWIVGPLKCLFIPQKPISNRTSLVTARFEEKGPGELLNEVQAAMEAIPNGSGCKGPLMPFDMSDYGVSVDVYPLDACSGAMATVAGYVKILLTVVISFQGVLAVIRAIGVGVGVQIGLRGDSNERGS